MACKEFPCKHAVAAYADMTKSLHVCEQINLASFTLYSKVVAELALEAFSALPCSEILAHHRLGVNACSIWYLHHVKVSSNPDVGLSS